MFARTKGIVMAACVLLCTLTLLGGRPNMPPRPRPNPVQTPESPANMVAVLVEAFAVEVNLPALAELGVSPIGAEPHAVSVADILKCLSSGRARVIAGAKAASDSPAMTKVRATRTAYVKLEKGNPPQATNYNPYESGRQFSAEVRAMSGTAVSVGFSFSHTRFTRNTQADNVPPDTESWDWSGSTVLELGTPQIVAAAQDGETAVFLLLTAHLQSEASGSGVAL
jgi:hypothetical protein